MKKTALTDALRNIRKRFVSWLSIVTIVIIGTSIILGLFFSWNTLAKSGNDYIAAHSLKDMDLICSIGVRETDLSDIRGVDGVKEAEGVLSFPAEIGYEGKQFDVTLISATEKISVPYAVEGRLPEAEDECAVSQKLPELAKLSVGDKVTVTVTSSRLENILTHKEFTVTGIAGNPDYMTQSGDHFCVLPRSAFDTSDSAFDYTNVVIRLDLPNDGGSPVKIYDETVFQVKERIEAKLPEMSERRMQSLSKDLDNEYAKAEEKVNSELEDARKKLREGRQEYDDKIAEAEKKLTDGEKELQDAREKAEKELADAEKKIKDGERQYREGVAEGEAKIADGERTLEKELKDGKWKLFDGLQQIDQNEKLLNEKEQEYAQSKQLLEKAKEELDRARNMDPDERAQTLLALYDNLMDSVDPQVKEEIESQVDIGSFRDDPTAGEEIEKILDGVEKVLEIAQDQLDEGRKLLDQGWFALEQAKKELAAGEQELNVREAEARQQLADGRAKLEEEKAKGEKQLKDARAAYEAGKKEAEEKLAEGEKELADGRAEFNAQKEDALKELADGEKKVADGEAEAKKLLADLKKQIDDAKATDCNWFIQTRNANIGYCLYTSYCDVLFRVFVVFTVIYACIVIVVCFFTMSIIMEEEAKLIGTCKALGMYQSEIRNKYLLFGVTGAFMGAVLGILGGFAMEWTICDTVAVQFYFGALPHRFSLAPLLLLPAGAALATAIAVVWSSKRILSCSAVGLISGNEPAGRGRTQSSASRAGSIYFRLIIRNFFMDLGREIVSVLIIVMCCMLIGLGTTVKLGHAGALKKQTTEILLYDICLTMSDTATDEDYDRVRQFLEKYETVSVCKMGGVVQNDAGQVLTEIYVVDDIDRFRQFYHLTDESGADTPLPEDGILVTKEMEDKNKLTKGQDVTLFTDRFKLANAAVKETYVLYFGKCVIMSDAYYKQIFDDETENNTWLIRTVDADARNQAVEQLSRLEGVSSVELFNKIVDDNAVMTRLYNAVVGIVIGFSMVLSFMILLNLSSILVAHRKKELLTMRVNGFSDGQVIGFLVREVLATLLAGAVLGLLIGIPATGQILPQIESNGFMFLRKTYALAWILAVSCNVIFSLIINAVAFRNVTKVPVTDISK